MIVGEILLYAGLVFGLLASITLLIHDSKRYKIDPFFIMAATRATLLILSVAMSILVYHFVMSDYGLLYVWQYCSNDLPLLYKIAAVLAGEQGTYLFWAWASVFAVWVMMEEYGFRNSLHRKTELVALVISIFILLLCIKSDPFRSIFDMIDYIPKDGNGLNPVFITIWMVIHPFVTFVSYVAVIVPASAAIVHLVTGVSGWNSISKQWIRVSWFWLSVGMATGGAWAYKLSGWGGFWNWDPVQTATLVLWLLLTIVLHILARYREGRDYTTAAPVSTILLFVATIYITLITREGIIHSLHDFPGTETAGLLVLGIAITLVVTLLLGIRKFLTTVIVSAPVKSIFAPRNTFLWTNVLLTIIAFVCFWGITYSFISQHILGTKIIIPQEFFNAWCYIPVLLLTTIIGVCMLHDRIHDKYLKYIILLVLFTSLALALLPSHTLLDMEGEFYQSSSIAVRLLGSISVWSFLPSFSFALVATIYKLSRDFRRTHGRMRLRSFGINLIHLGFVFVLAGAIVTTSFDDTHDIIYDVTELGAVKELGGGWSVELTDFNVIQNPDGTWAQVACPKVYRNGEYYCIGKTEFSKTGQYGDLHVPMIDRSIQRDIYIQFHGTRSHISTEAVVPITIRIVPWMSLLWTGCILMLVGVYCTTMSVYLMVVRKREKATEAMRR